jgi:very-short-patch-repair endonuclease
MARPGHTERAQAHSHALRTHLTVSEARVWGAIKACQTGAKFRRQVPIGPWIADFASFHPKLVIEIDDESHDWRDETERTEYLWQQGFRVLRFRNEEVAKDLPGVFSTIENWVEILRDGADPDE